ncbi:Group 3 secretory phospholipase A2 [Bagarius yarrelli]|uniref:phospholipase A2 n=1 Tax=Bagarius yarrelli TaxID=175774 RepID=A0A556V006_BAGYA|nr:Group 3 secretory phospholipase A2 [Bagarius yarrelli]
MFGPLSEKPAWLLSKSGHCCFVKCEAQSRWALGITPSLVAVVTVAGSAPRRVIRGNLERVKNEVTLEGDFANGQLSALEAEKDSPISYFQLNRTPCADPSSCHVELSPRKADDGKEKSKRQKTEDATSDTHTLRRSKRGFTYPGTLWCGAGNIADNYDQLGEFAETDKCCRTHDQCPHVIHAFSSRYSFTNFKWHSISHCDCDNTLKQCLRAVNDTSSRVVGQAFFNVIESPCFEFSLEEQCVERHWYGVCKRYDKVPVALIRESVPYDFGGIEVIDVLTIAPPKLKLNEVNSKQEEIQRSESSTQSSTLGSKNPALEKPSLTNVVTVAEDFIKVLATVSTSQSSSSNGGHTSETQALDKKRKKNVGKKKKAQKKGRGMGKGKKRKQNTSRFPKVNDSVTVALPANRAEDVINKKTYVGDSDGLDWVNKNNNFINSQFNSVRDIKHSNKMMRDEHLRTPATTTATHTMQQANIIKESRIQFKGLEYVQLISTVPATITSKQPTSIPEVAKKRQRHPMSLHVKGTLHYRMADNTAVSTNKSTSSAGPTTHTHISFSGEESLYNVESKHEKESAFNATTQNRPIVEAKRLRSRQKGRRKSRKLYSPSSPIDALTTEKSNDTTLTVFPFPKSQSVLQRLQSNRPKNMTEKPLTIVSGKIRIKTLKGTRVKKIAQQAMGAFKEEQEFPSIINTNTSMSSAVTDLSEASTGLSVSRLQTITPSLKPLKIQTSKRRKSEERNEKIKRKNKDIKQV